MSGEHRHLAAILFTDIVGYTSKMQENELEAVSMVKRHRSVLQKAVADYEGDVIEYFGDGSLSIFSSITDATNAAIEIQKQLQKEPAVPLRIGMHIGEVLMEEGKVMGDGVNLASRIQALGQAGSILFSKEIHDKIRNHSEFKSVPLGRFKLKNVEEPMSVYALANEGFVIPTKEQLTGRLKHLEAPEQFRIKRNWILVPAFVVLLALMAALIINKKEKEKFTGKEKSIAVLPFENIGNDSLQEYFSDGITEDIITQLSKIADLKVISRTSIMQYKNTTKNIRQIADELNVAAILEGSVRKEANNVRISAQLIDANSDRHIWVEQYDRKASEVLNIQSEVAQRIATELNAKLTTDEGKRIEQKATGNMEAYEEYLKSRQTRMSPQEAERLLRSALAKDSTFALAWAGLAYTYSHTPPKTPEDIPYYARKSLDAALTAVAYGPELSETHMVLGDVLKKITLNSGLSIKELNKSIALNPNNAEAYTFLAFAQMELGNFKEAEINLRKAQQLDPLSQITRAAWLSLYRYSRNAEKLLAIMQQRPDSSRRWLLGESRIWYYFVRDKYDSILLSENRVRDPALLGIAYVKTGQIPKATKILDSLKSASAYNNAFDIAIIYAWLGENKNAMEYLNIAYRLYDYQLISIKVNKFFDPLRDDQEFKDFLKKMGME